MPSEPPASRTEQLARYAAALLGLSIPISVALDNVLLALVVVLWLAGGGIRKKLADIAANPVALAAAALFGMLAAGLLYGSRDPGDGMRFIGKYADLLFIPLFVTLFSDARIREMALRWFCVAMVLSFAVAEVRLMGLLVDNPVLPRGLGFTGGAFKLSITHGLLSALAAFLFALLAHREPRWPQRLLFAALALVAVKNVILISISRTAYLVLGLLALYYCFTRFGRRGVVIASVVLAAVFAGLYTGSEAFRERVGTVIAQTGVSQSQWPSRDSVTVREDWYRYSLDIALDHPVLGAGTGSFPRAYAEKARDATTPLTPNPHNEYLLIAVQTGIVGLALLLHLFWQHWRLSASLATPLDTHLARGVLIAVAAGCLFNSLLLDHTEGLLYAWFTGLLYGGLRPPPHAAPRQSR